MRQMCHLILFVLIHSTDSSASQDNACGLGDFCTYKCHCDRPCDGTDGLCPKSSKCVTGWFGLRCQYLDLVTVDGAILTMNPSQEYTGWLTDRDDVTCNTDPHLKSVTVTWNRAYPLTWIRISMSSFGRNIAYKQTATQTSTHTEASLKRPASLAVDGNTDSDYYKLSCSHTGPLDYTPRFELKLQSAYVVNRFVLYNREPTSVIVSKRIKGFLIQTHDDSNKVVGQYKDNSSSYSLVYYINVNSSSPVTSISINETEVLTPTDLHPILTICELEAYGECPPGRWSLPCTRQCNSSCPTSCHIDDGSCGSVCVGYRNPPDCTDACSAGNWGINCGNNCSNRCVESSCDSTSGLCKRGCTGYRDPPYCTQDCNTGWWGVNCSSKCAINCYTSDCNHTTGHCSYGCKGGYTPPDCTEEFSRDRRQFVKDFGAGFGAGAGAVLIAVFALLIKITANRRKAVSSLKRPSDQPCYNKPSFSSENENVYEKIEPDYENK
ncbi:hypothetical protein Btru_013958 [Bulinus truncatus]|nr:hypothetical protein Btru_013958 [Bulinus truncatus]